MVEADGRQRIDKWLFFARIVKSRTLAAKLAQSGRVRVNSAKIDQASRQISAGDVLTITLDRRIRVLRVVRPGQRRGPSREAVELYEDLSPPPRPDAQAFGASHPARSTGAGRPTKRQRRQLDKWQSPDA